jgi:hypothetical protein
MAQTIYLPVTGNLTGDLADEVPDDLQFRLEARAEDGVSATFRRVFYPFGYDQKTNTNTHPNQTIVDLGVIDPVDLVQRANGPNQGTRWATDDYFVNLSVAPDGADGYAVVRIIDAAGCDRFGCFQLPLAPPENGVRVCTRYGIPMQAGDRIVLEWQGDSDFVGKLIITASPATSTEAFIDAICCLISTTAQGPVPAECEPPVINSYSTNPTPVVEGQPGPPVVYSGTILGAGFLSTDTIQIVGGPSGAIPVINQTFVSGVQWDFTFQVTNGKAAGTYQLCVIREEDPGCFDCVDFPVVVAP